MKVISDLGTVLFRKTLRQDISSIGGHYDVAYWSKTVNKYLNDYSSTTVPSILRIQAHRLKNTLVDWQGSLCHYEYPFELFCKLPYPNSEDKFNFVSIKDLLRIFSEKTTGLCYSIWGDLWCNWHEFIDLMSIVVPINFF